MSWGPRMNLTKHPIGSLVKEPKKEGSFYRVDGTGHIVKVGLNGLSAGWFAPLSKRLSGKYGWGYVFDNYFHAFAYSLKVEEQLKEKNNA
jgi:hypothetical protein